MTVVAPVIVVGCGSAKRDRPAPAADLYTGSLFRAAARAAAADGRDWLICSAAHGLVRPEQVLAPYDQPLRSDATDLDRLARLIVSQAPPRQVELWAPARYGEALARAGVLITRAPLHGLGIGEQIGWLTRWARSCQAWQREYGRPPGPGIVGDWWLLAEPAGLRYAGSLTEHHGIEVLHLSEGRTVDDGSLLGLTYPRVVLANGVHMNDVRPSSLVRDPPAGRTPNPATTSTAAPATRPAYRTAATGPARAARGKDPRCST
jgi:hypothetical protein